MFGVRIAVSAVPGHFSCFVHGASQMPYAPATYCDHVFRTLRQASADFDWGEQWVGAFAPILQTRRVQHLLDLGCGTGNDV